VTICASVNRSPRSARGAGPLLSAAGIGERLGHLAVNLLIKRVHGFPLSSDITL
jgi:hypothetical protein